MSTVHGQENAMRRLTRHTLPAALCLSLLAVPTTAAGAASAPERPASAPASAPVPGADALLKQVSTLGNVAEVLRPATALVEAILKADEGKVPQADLDKHVTALKAAVDKLKASLPAAPAVPVPVPPVDAPDLPVEAPKLPVEAPKLPVEAPKLPVEAPKLPAEAPKPPADAPKLPVKADAAAAPLRTDVRAGTAAGPLDLINSALDGLLKAVEGLTKAAGPCGCAADAGTKVTDVLTSLINALLALLAGAGLPVPNLPGLPPIGLPVAAR
ncbi:hypothetical protein [Streptomyces sp. NPDC012888]|uniref:hypothetical protein n=1 Tax=Streptomyces sp. NPDC012888 TaxID=3364855 RepID=UPI003699BEE0